jgi:hypothetical protein
VTRAATPPGSYDSFTACSAAASFIESRAILKQDFAMLGVIRLCALAMPYALAGRTPKVTPNNCPPSIVCRRRQMGASRRANGGRGVSTVAGDNVISPMPIALVEGRREAHWYRPKATNTLGARKTNALHQVNQVEAQTRIRRYPVDSFYARHLDSRGRLQTN